MRHMYAALLKPTLLDPAQLDPVTIQPYYTIRPGSSVHHISLCLGSRAPVISSITNMIHIFQYFLCRETVNFVVVFFVYEIKTTS
jgi:DeoR/GlpR family transcriptional regulator of sugar metabolism